MCVCMILTLVKFTQKKKNNVMGKIVSTYIFALHCQIHVQVCCFVQGKMYMMPIVKYKFINENFIRDLFSFFRR